MKTSSSALALAIMAATYTSTASGHDHHENEKDMPAASMKGSVGKEKGGEERRPSLRSLKKKDTADYSWLVGKYDSCTKTDMTLNEGEGVIVREDIPCVAGEELTIAAFGSTTNNRIFQANYINPALPCASLGLFGLECPETFDTNIPIIGSKTTTIRYELEGVGSYAKQQADQIVFVTDHFQFLKVVNGTNEWVDSFNSNGEEIDVMTCLRLKDDRQLTCDHRFQFTTLDDYSYVPGILGPHFQTLGSWFWEEAAAE